MDRNLPIENITKDLRYITLFFVKISLLIGFLAIIVGFSLCLTLNTGTCLAKESLFFFGTFQVLIGILRFLFYSSYSSGFDAIWTPGMQGDIQRDERARQITGWSKATTGALMILLGILVLLLYIRLFV